MSDTNDSGNRARGASGSQAPGQQSQTSSSAGGKTLSLKRTETSTVRQSFSHGRSKAVVVEKKRVRTGGPNEKPAPVAEEAPRPVAPVVAPAPVVAAPRAPAPAPEPKRPAARGVVLRELTEDEKDARSRALAGAKIAEADARKRAVEDAKLRAGDEERNKREMEAAEKRKAEEDARKHTEDEVRRRAEAEASRRLGTVAPVVNIPLPTADIIPPKRGRDLAEEDEEATAKKSSKPGSKVPVPVRKPVVPPRRTGKLTITRALSDDDERTRSLASFRRQLNRAHRQQQAPAQAGPREVIVPETITVAELANRMARRGVDVIKILMKSGQMVTTNDIIDADTAELVATELGHSVKRVAEDDVLEGLRGQEDDTGSLTPRAPIVTVMGHVDHGKTSLLDALRKTDVVKGEAGGITQHIGAYQVQLAGGAKITFLDTPGHAAFTQMRARGAQVTDIVILVVAADDGVMPQTAEAIVHAKAAGVPIIVAINKIDKPDADPMRVKTGLLQHEIQVEDMGGETLAVEVSAKTGLGLDKLEEAILLQAEVLALSSNPNRPGEGAVIEAKLDKGRGPVATVLVSRGTLKVGDIVVAGAEWGRVRALVNDRGETVPAALPSQPVEVLGLSGTPDAGDEFVVVESEARAREVTEYRIHKKRNTKAKVTRQSLDQLLQNREAGEKRLLPLVLKADVQGSAEAIAGALEALGTGEVGVQILQNGVGGITESDVILAQASGAAIMGFNVRANAQARDRARSLGVEIRYYNIIYNIVDDVKAVLTGMLTPEIRERFLGNAEILEVFTISKVGKVAGCRVTEGLVRRGAKVRLIRDSVVVHEGDLSTLKRFKDEVKEVQSGQECGMAFIGYQDIQKGDTIECYEVDTIKRSL